MSGVEFVIVTPDDEGCRLDKWLKRRYPQLTQGQIQKLLRSKQIKVDNKKVEASFHVEAGQTVRVPPLADKGSVMKNAAERRAAAVVSDEDAAFVRSLVLHKDDQIIVINKPAGLAVQGGTGQTRHLDGLLSALRFEKQENPRLVHRLDKETSGVLVLARTPAAAAKLADAFAKGLAKKVYWALVDGNPEMQEGKIDAKLLKVSGENGGESVVVDNKNGKRAVTLYRVADTVYGKAAWLELMPLTGRTHQLRVHCAYMGHAILGDSKYAKDVKSDWLPNGKSLHLHAYAVRFPHPSGKMFEISAPLNEKMAQDFDFLGFSYKMKKHPFKEFMEVIS